MGRKTALATLLVVILSAMLSQGVSAQEGIPLASNWQYQANELRMLERLGKGKAEWTVPAGAEHSFNQRVGSLGEGWDTGGYYVVFGTPGAGACDVASWFCHTARENGLACVPDSPWHKKGAIPGIPRRDWVTIWNPGQDMWLINHTGQDVTFRWEVEGNSVVIGVDGGGSGVGVLDGWIGELRGTPDWVPDIVANLLPGWLQYWKLGLVGLILLVLLILIQFLNLQLENRRLRQELENAGYGFVTTEPKRFGKAFFWLGLLVLIISFIKDSTLLLEIGGFSLGFALVVNLGKLWEKVREEGFGWPVPVLPRFVRQTGFLLVSTVALAYLVGVIVGGVQAFDIPFRGKSEEVVEREATPIPYTWAPSHILPDPGPSLQDTAAELRSMARQKGVHEELLLAKFWIEGGYYWNPQTGEWSEAREGRCEGCSWIGLRHYLPNGKVVESYSGAHGIGQVFVPVHPEYDVARAEKDWKYSAEYSVEYFRLMKVMHGSSSNAVRRYHSPAEAEQGLENVKKFLADPPLNPETGELLWQPVPRMP